MRRLRRTDRRRLGETANGREGETAKGRCGADALPISETDDNAAKRWAVPGAACYLLTELPHDKAAPLPCFATPIALSALSPIRPIAVSPFRPFAVSPKYSSPVPLALVRYSNFGRYSVFLISFRSVWSLAWMFRLRRNNTRTLACHRPGRSRVQ
jgi:hypothetical protein